MKPLRTAIFLFILVQSQIAAVTAYMNDGSKVQGEAIEVNEDVVVLKTDQGIVSLPRFEVFRLDMEFKNPQAQKTSLIFGFAAGGLMGRIVPDANPWHGGVGYWLSAAYAFSETFALLLELRVGNTFGDFADAAKAAGGKRNFREWWLAGPAAIWFFSKNFYLHGGIGLARNTSSSAKSSNGWTFDEEPQVLAAGWGGGLSLAVGGEFRFGPNKMWGFTVEVGGMAAFTRVTTGAAEASYMIPLSAMVLLGARYHIPLD